MCIFKRASHPAVAGCVTKRRLEAGQRGTNVGPEEMKQAAEGRALIYTTTSSRAPHRPPSPVPTATGSITRWLFLRLLVGKTGVIIPITYLRGCCEFS